MPGGVPGPCGHGLVAVVGLGCWFGPMTSGGSSDSVSLEPVSFKHSPVSAQASVSCQLPLLCFPLLLRPPANSSPVLPQSKLGYLALVLCTAHTLVYGGKWFLVPSSYKWCLPPVYMLSLVVPCAVLVLKFVLVFPCLDKPLTQIRQGWERNPQRPEPSHLIINKSAV